MYINTHFVVTTCTLAFIYLFRNEHFYFVRNMFMVAMALALVGYVLYPTAPPRMLPELGFADSVSDFTGVSSDASVNALFNPYAAVPSMHVGFALMLAVPMVRMARRAWVRALWVAYAPVVTLVVVVTAQPLGAGRRRGSRRGGRRGGRRADAVRARAAAARGRGRPSRPFPPRPAPDRLPPPMATRDYQAEFRNRLIQSRLTPNAISLTGFALCVVSAVLVLQGWWIAGGIAFIVGSVCDTLDGRYSRMSGKGSPFGAFLDSTLDRLEEGIVLAAVGYRLVEGPGPDGDRERRRRRRASSSWPSSPR